MRLPGRDRSPSSTILPPRDSAPVRGIGGADIAVTCVLLAVSAAAAAARLDAIAVSGALAAAVVSLASLLSATAPTTARAATLVGLLVLAGLLVFGGLLYLVATDAQEPRLWIAVLAAPTVVTVSVVVARHWSRVRFAAQLESTRTLTAIAAREQERRRWAYNLHDDTLQQLSAMRMMLAAAGRTPDRAAAQDAVRHVTTLIEDQIVGLRHMLTDLRPLSLDELGLGPALEVLAQRIEALHGLPVHVDLPPSVDLPALPERAATAAQEAIYRVVQEALANAGKHARASCAVVRLRPEADRLTAEVVDDGVGFSPPVPAGFGISSMAERVDALHGRLEIRSDPGRGTTVVVSIPRAADRRGSGGHPDPTARAAHEPVDRRLSARLLNQVMRRGRWAAAAVVTVFGALDTPDLRPPFPLPVATGLFALAIVAANLLLPAPSDTRGGWRGLVPVLVDALLTLAAIDYLQFDPGTFAWIGLLVVVGEAAWRLPLRVAAPVSFGMTSAYLAVTSAAAAQHQRGAPDLEAFGMVVLLCLAVLVVVSTTLRRSSSAV